MTFGNLDILKLQSVNKADIQRNTTGIAINVLFSNVMFLMKNEGHKSMKSNITTCRINEIES